MEIMNRRGTYDDMTCNWGQNIPCPHKKKSCYYAENRSVTGLDYRTCEHAQKVSMSVRLNI